MNSAFSISQTELSFTNIFNIEYNHEEWVGPPQAENFEKMHVLQQVL